MTNEIIQSTFFRPIDITFASLISDSDAAVFAHSFLFVCLSSLQRVIHTLRKKMSDFICAMKALFKKSLNVRGLQGSTLTF